MNPCPERVICIWKYWWIQNHEIIRFEDLISVWRGYIRYKKMNADTHSFQTVDKVTVDSLFKI